MALATTGFLISVTAVAAEPSPSSPSSTTTPGKPTPKPTDSSPTPKPTKTTTPPKPTDSPTPSKTPQPKDDEPKDSGRTDGQGPGDDGYLDRTSVASQIAAADALWAELTASNATLAAALKDVQAAAAKSNTLLESLSTSRTTERTATTAADQAKVELGVLQGRLQRSRDLVREWAFQAYSSGGFEGEAMAVLDAMKAEEAEVGDPMGDLSYLTDQRVRAVADARSLTERQATLTAQRNTALADAKMASAKIAKEKAQLDALIAPQRAKIEKLQKAHAAEVAKAGPIAAALAGLQTPEAKAAYDKLVKALGSSFSKSSIGKPCTDENTFYPNGMYPASALCPLWQASGESLAPRAAAAFNAMSQAYAEQTGSPLCVTDSYRSLPDQISIKASRGRFAAKPGTSRHGLGMALDMCGGVNNFGTAAHLWMKQNAPLYGWFHPAWAGPRGATPEPWHWEFAG